MHDSPLQLLELIESRQSDRGLFDANRAIPSADMDKLLDAARWAPTAHNMQNFEIVIVGEKSILGAISAIKIAPDPMLEDLKDEEGSSSLIRQIASSSALLFVLYDPSRRAPASEGDFLGIVSLGCAMENMWLMAASLGIGVQIVSSLSRRSAAAEIAKLLKFPDNFVIAFSMRLGYPLSPVNHCRVRRDQDAFVHRNRFTT